MEEIENQNDALLNEYKGNLFEYLVALFLAKQFKLEAIFLKSISKKSLERISVYERGLRKIAPDLLQLLPKQAESLALKLLKKLPNKIDDIWVIGKMNCQMDIGSWNEADILVKEGSKVFPISLKLSKSGSYINTKSGGIGSFIAKYFDNFEEANNLQIDLNELIDYNYSKMAEKLYENMDLGSFDQDFSLWKKLDLAELPGALGPEHKKIVVSSYRPLSDFLFESLKILNDKDPKKFQQSLRVLLGQSGKDLLQGILFHKSHKDYKKQIETQSVVKKLKEYEIELESLVFRNSKGKSGYFYLDFPSFSMQIRIKPMNKFTVKGFKVNCSVKYLDI